MAHFSADTPARAKVYEFALAFSHTISASAENRDTCTITKLALRWLQRSLPITELARCKNNDVHHNMLAMMLRLVLYGDFFNDDTADIDTEPATVPPDSGLEVPHSRAGLLSTKLAPDLHGDHRSITYILQYLRDYLHQISCFDALIDIVLDMVWIRGLRFSAFFINALMNGIIRSQFNHQKN
jgi:hypothetical protein